MKNIYNADLETLIKEAESGDIDAQYLLEKNLITVQMKSPKILNELMIQEYLCYN